MSEPSYKIRPVFSDPNHEPNKAQAQLSKLQSEFSPPSVPSTCSNTITLATGDGSAPAIRPVARQQRPEDQFRETFRTTLVDLFGDGIFNADGDNWKFQRQVSSHEFNTKSLRKFVEQMVDTELSDRLIPILSASAASSSVLDFQDILQRFGFDNICRIAFGYDPDYLLPSLPEAKFAVAFDEAVQISSDRLRLLHPVWKLKRALGIESEKRLRAVVSEVREFAKAIVREKKRDLSEAKVLESVDLLSRFFSSGHTDAKFVTDIVISFTLAGRDTTSAALTWSFWLLSQNPCVENEILMQINETASSESAAGGVYDEVKEMVYTHAALCENMRLYPPAPTDSKQAANDDVLPDATKASSDDHAAAEKHGSSVLVKSAATAAKAKDNPVITGTRSSRRTSMSTAHHEKNNGSASKKKAAAPAKPKVAAK
ncbi:hypothetical protein ACFX2I_043215 [Malus domestica]